MGLILWSIDSSGAGKLRAYRGEDASTLQAVHRFDSLDELPGLWSEAIRRSGRTEGEASVRDSVWLS